MTQVRKYSALGLIAALLLSDATFEWTFPFVSLSPASPAQARIGHPLTPLSYAGVARRTTRRVVRRTAVRISALPAGCVYGPYYGAYYYNCGGIYYVKSGTVYVQVIIE